MLKKTLILLASHGITAGLAFLIGVYSLPIIMAAPDPTSGALALTIKNTRYVATISESLADSDWLHWGEGRFSLGDDYIVFQGKLAPGPAYRLYLSPTFIETEKDFFLQKSNMVEVGKVNSFANYILPVATDISIEDYNSVIIWCESFNQFITAAQFR
ncbi:MAG: DM13 domain-containing protein [Oleispira sp.]